MCPLKSWYLLVLSSLFFDSVLANKSLVDFREKGSENNNKSVHYNATLLVPQKRNYTQNITTQHVISEGGVDQVIELPKFNVTTAINKTLDSNNSLITVGQLLTNVTAGKPVGNNTNLTLRKNKEKVTKPVHEVSLNNEAEVPSFPQDFEKPVVPKKGVNFSVSDLETTGKNLNANSIINNNNNSSTINHKKPIYTESDSDFIDINSEENNNENTLTIDQIDPLLTKKNYNRSDYIIPIVAVILSVPLVAILISMIYKRSADWWQHRNYKRMDFLIEGIYHN